MSNFNCDSCGIPILDSPMGYITGCPHYPIEGKGSWLPMNSEPLDFGTHGFQSGRTVQVCRSNGQELVAIYHGYGLFSPYYNREDLFDDVTHWRPGSAVVIPGLLQTTGAHGD